MTVLLINSLARVWPVPFLHQIARFITASLPSHVSRAYRLRTRSNLLCTDTSARPSSSSVVAEQRRAHKKYSFGPCRPYALLPKAYLQFQVDMHFVFEERKGGRKHKARCIASSVFLKCFKPSGTLTIA
jgi:hypothetical protein